MLASWLPHYLTWPWWPDLDAYASLAQGWDRGIRPYRDVRVLNFPGQVYLFWALGKTFGWGRTAPIYAVDAGLLLLLGAAMTLWSRRRFGRALPGLVGFAAAIAHYAGQDIRHVAQRDWQGPLLAMLGLLAIQTWPDRRGRLGSAALMAMAATIRPHVVLFLPALAMAIVGSPGTTWRQAGRSLAGWALAFVGMLAVCFLPLLAQGLFGDFLRGIRAAGYDRQYSRVTPNTMLASLLAEVKIRRIGVSLVLGGMAWFLASPMLRRTVRPWSLTLLIALIYKPLHPRPHLYLDHPLWLAWSIHLAAILAVALEKTLRRPALATSVIFLALGLALPGVPRYCDPRSSLRAALGSGGTADPDHVPPGARPFFRPATPTAAYAWGDYLRLMHYLRTETGRTTPVANFARNVPFLPVNGPVGRISPWPAESGTIWLWAVDGSREGEFLRAVRDRPDCLLVWSPDEVSDEARRQLPSLARELRDLFRPAAKFGPIEVWRRK